MATKGSCTPKETREKQSEARKSFFLTPAGIQEKERMRIYMTNRVVSNEIRLKMSEGNKGNHKKLGYRLTPKQIENMSKGLKAFFKTIKGEEVIVKRNAKLKGRPSNMKGRHHSKEARDKLSIAIKGIKRSDETKLKCSQNMKEFWGNQESKNTRVKAILVGMAKRPTKPELSLLALLNQSDSMHTWEYVGDGQLIISGKNPDCWNGDHKLAELFGDYWHREQNPQDRVNLFAEYGYDTIVVWERELKYPKRVLLRIKDFLGRS